MPRLYNEKRFNILAMFECGRLQNDVVIRLSVSRSIKMHLLMCIIVTDIFSNKPRPRAPRVTSIRHGDYERQRHLRNRTVTAYLAYFIVRCNQERTIIRNTTRSRLKNGRITIRRPYHFTVLPCKHDVIEWNNVMC